MVKIKVDAVFCIESRLLAEKTSLDIRKTSLLFVVDVSFSLDFTYNKTWFYRTKKCFVCGKKGEETCGDSINRNNAHRVYY